MKKKNAQPLVSVVIPTYNSRRTIEKCLRSVEKQTYSNIEIIVVDGLKYNPDEKKKCQKIIKKYARYFEDGPERSIQRNRGIKEAKGKYIFTIDQDMYLTPEVVAECVEMMEDSDHVALLIPEISIGQGYWTEVVALERYVTIYLETSPNECCRFFRKSDAEKIGGYHGDIVGAEDSDFHYRMLQLGTIGKINAHINHDEGVTSFWGRVKKKYYYSGAFRKYLQRHPEAAAKQFFPVKPVYFKHLGLLLSKPHLLGGIVLLRGAEVLAGVTGILVKR